LKLKTTAAQASLDDLFVEAAVEQGTEIGGSAANSAEVARWSGCDEVSVAGFFVVSAGVWAWFCG